MKRFPVSPNRVVLDVALLSATLFLGAAAAPRDRLRYSERREAPGPSW